MEKLNNVSNKTQYIRLLAEINAAGIDEEQMKDLEASMEMGKADIEQVLENAEQDFDLIKQTLGFPAYADGQSVGIPITKEEAAIIAKEQSGIIAGGGYTLLPGIYCAMGSVPGCFRGGNTATINDKIEQWYKLNLRELIIRHGFYPCGFSIGMLVDLQAKLHDYSINIPEMVKFCIDGPYTSEQLKNSSSFGDSVVWTKYFEVKDSDVTTLTAAQRGNLWDSSGNNPAGDWRDVISTRDENQLHEYFDQQGVPRTVPAKKKWTVWLEGFSATGNQSGAMLKGTFEGNTFEEACRAWVATLKEDERKSYDRDRNTYWGCRLFDNEADARRTFG